MRVTLLAVLIAATYLYAQDSTSESVATAPSANISLAKYFAVETQRIADQSLQGITTLEAWQRKRPKLQQELLEMLGLDPMPERTDLKATITGTLERDGIVVENLYFQSRPGLYVTGNLYRPREVDEKLPAILYVCGHAGVKQDGISYGNKTAYQHHGAWFARNGYVCLTIDTIQLGELEGIHHGTYRENMWWWLNRGYTPAGVEAWNCVRAIDYLETREEVDADRIGITGRSGGGAYSWWTAAIDERVKVAVPVAGITDLTNHVVDGTVEGHCDCMFMVNTHRWDYDTVAALIAPRPLLISNTDRDNIFPLDGVYRTYNQVRRIYELHDAAEEIALHITAGPHKDTQELRIHAFRWFNHYLKQDDSLITDAAEKVFEPVELKVFASLPQDEVTTTIHETFVPLAESPTVPRTPAEWTAQRDDWMKSLRSKAFAGWPEQDAPLELELAFDTTKDNVRLRAFDFESQMHVPLRLLVVQRKDAATAANVELVLLDDDRWSNMQTSLTPDFDTDDAKALRDSLTTGASARVYFSPRGIGPYAWDGEERWWTQTRRRFYLLGQSLDGMRTYDVRRAIQGVRQIEEFSDVPLSISGSGRLGAVGLYASLFESGISRVRVRDVPESYKSGPYLLNVDRFLHLPQVAAMVVEHSNVEITGAAEIPSWEYPQAVAELLGSANGIEIQ